MSRERTRYCPRGHDKDLPGGSRWWVRKTKAGGKTWNRLCAICANQRAVQYYYDHLPAGKKRRAPRAAAPPAEASG
jgi:hypothetical protein